MSSSQKQHIVSFTPQQLIPGSSGVLSGQQGALSAQLAQGAGEGVQSR